MAKDLLSGRLPRSLPRITGFSSPDEPQGLSNGIIVEVGTGIDSGALGGCGGAHWIILLARGAVDIDSAHVVVGESSGKGNE
jgi:hypothetical protein